MWWLVILLLLKLTIFTCSSKKQNTKETLATAKTNVKPVEVIKNELKEDPKPKPPSSEAPKEAQKSLPKKEDTLLPDGTQKTLHPEQIKRNENCTIWANRVAKRKCKEISQEHKDYLKTYQAPGHTYKAHDTNQVKNRYTDVLCIDSTRVVLKGKGKDDDYIHASYIVTPSKQTTYICTQGPLPETLADFWAMIMQEKSKFVLMMCSLIEGGGEKCTKYYPEKLGEKEKYGTYEVEVIEEKKDLPCEEIIWNILRVTNEGEKFDVNHVIVPWWPDQLAPVESAPLLKLYRWVKTTNPKNSPITVHCSAGVGRTATFVGIDYASDKILEDSNVELQDIVKEMRSKRFQSIQSHVQYLFLHVCLLEYFIEEGWIKKSPGIEAFITQYRSHAKKKIDKRRDGNKTLSQKGV